MRLQRAITIALWGLSCLLIVSLVNWALLSLNIISYFDNVRLFKIFQLLIILLQSVPLIIFLLILKKSQH
jgi:hypothetical protein